MRTLLLAVTCAAGLASAQPPATATPLRLVLGWPVVIEVVNRQTICDDGTLVSAEPVAGDTGTRVTGLKLGKTQCSFGAFVGKGARRLYDIEVVAPPPKAP